MEPKERIKALTAKSNVVVTDSVPVMRYYRSGPQMIRQAKIYLDEGKIDSAYFLCLRYVTLFLEGVRKHRDQSTVSKEEKSQVAKEIRRMMQLAEQLKPRVEKQFEKEHEEWIKNKEIEEEKRRQRESEESSTVPSAPPAYIPDFYIPSSPSSFTGGLRNIVIPSSLIPKFLDLARRNTQNNVETCGLLTGTLQRDRLTITVLLIPQQTGSSDECTAENDIATFDAIESRGLLTLGWIHTHPSQQAFLSSVDLHNQYGYQAMMPEAVAIVCAPKYSNEVFRLSDMGLDSIRACQLRGFHPHSGPQLFETAGHAQQLDVPCEVVDLRNSGKY